jgi:hypothetical protein
VEEGRQPPGRCRLTVSSLDMTNRGCMGASSGASGIPRRVRPRNGCVLPANCAADRSGFGGRFRITLLRRSGSAVGAGMDGASTGALETPVPSGAPDGRRELLGCDYFARLLRLGRRRDGWTAWVPFAGRHDRMPPHRSGATRVRSRSPRNTSRDSVRILLVSSCSLC